MKAVLGALALAVLVAGCAASTPAPTSAASPTSPADSERAAKQLLDRPGTITYGSAVDADGDLVALWSPGYTATKPTAIAIRTASGSRSLQISGAGLHVLASLRSGWLVGFLVGSRSVELVHPDGTLTKVVDSHETTAAQPRDVLISRFERPRLFRPSDHTMYRLQPGATKGRGLVSVVAADGALISLATRHGTAEIGRFESGAWTYTPIDSGAGVAQGDTVIKRGYYLVAYATYHPAPLGDDAEDPVHVVAVSTDAGKHWRTTRVPEGESVVTSMAISRAATAFMTVGAPHGDCSLIRVPLHGAAACVHLVRVAQVFSDSDKVYTVPSKSRPRQLLVSTDDGVHWHAVPIPGRE